MTMDHQAEHGPLDPVDRAGRPRMRMNDNEDMTNELASLEEWLGRFASPKPSNALVAGIKQRMRTELDSQWFETVSSDPVVTPSTVGRVKQAVRRQLEEQRKRTAVKVLERTGSVRVTRFSWPMMPLASAAALAIVVLSALVGPANRDATPIGLMADLWHAGPIELAFRDDAAAIGSLELAVTEFEDSFRHNATSPIAQRMYEELNLDIEDMANVFDSMDRLHQS